MADFIKRGNKFFLSIGAILAIVGIIFLIFSKDNDLRKKLSKVDQEINGTIQPAEPLKIGFITDAHCYADYNKKTGEWNLNWRCQKPLEFFVEKMNKEYKPDFVIDNGDLIDGKDNQSRETFIKASEIYNKINAPKYHVLGNHETRSFYKNDWLELVGYDKPYYYFDTKRYRIIVLDGNNKILPDGSVVGTSPEAESYPGLIDPDQMTWLENLFRESKNYQKIVFVHQPLAMEETKTQEQLFIKGKELRELFSDNKVRAVFSGHIERFCLMRENGVDYYVSHGFWKANRGLKKNYQFKDEGFFSEILIEKDKIKVTAYHNPEINDEDGTGEYQSLEITPENANCSNWEAILTEEKEEIINKNKENE
jgi:predicted MPP superfamily phosphohydrolase